MKAVMKEKRNHRTIIFPFAREKLAVSHRVEQSLTYKYYNRRRAVNAARKKGKYNEQNSLIFSNGCFLAVFHHTTESSRVESCRAFVRLRSALQSLDGEIVILIILIDAALSLATTYSLLALYEL